MKYDNDWVKARHENGEHIEYIFFWGHQPKKNGQIGPSCFSQWFEREFVHQKIKYPTAEHWMMAEKARLFNDAEIMEEILKCESPKEAKRLGRKVKNFDEAMWVLNREEIVIKGNGLKFSQNNDLWNFLDGTKNKVLVEASPYDRVWGIGLGSSDIGIENPANWKGLNLLGYALMEVRDRLRNEKAVFNFREKPSV